MDLEQLTGLKVYPNSVVEHDDTTCFLARSDAGKRLGILGDAACFEGTRQGDVLLCPLTAENAAALRDRLPWLRPQPLGLCKSVGFGDRLGLATPGHVRAVRKFDLAPLFAQQSIRENARTGRTPRQVLDEAMWGLFQEGWREPWGADADHLKTTADITSCVAAGYTLYTIDPGDHVDNAAHTAPPAELEAKVCALPWDALKDTLQDMERRYLGRSFDLGEFALTFDRESLWRAAAKYGRAIAHTARMYRRLVETSPPPPHPPSPSPNGRGGGGCRGEGVRFELEVSVDETETPTSPLEHLFIASELRRLGVRWVSLAPRFVGRFEKGVDYIGDLAEFEAEFVRHAAIARALGPYKLSLHSGSDKFSLYPIIARHAGDLAHVKTAGTSYLEALRSLAAVDPTLFRQILTFARLRYNEDKATYHVSADPEKVPPPEALSNGELAGVLDTFDGRQVLHVTFGSVLDRFGERLKATLAEHEEAYYEALEAHFVKHLEPFKW
ncbi:MAG: tagaturonate epimerase family protein [Anaerolineae bacterium]|nr:tagaturonate epimerase family protein [Anaerolineae bacterium]